MTLCPGCCSCSWSWSPECQAPASQPPCRYWASGATASWTQTPTSGVSGSPRQTAPQTGYGARTPSPALLASHQQGHLFVAGCKTNQGKFYAQFDHIALLSAPADVLLARIAARTSNPYGKHPAERALILRDLAGVEPLLRATATIEIDATAPLSQVVRHLENLT